MKRVEPVAIFVDSLFGEYAQARARLGLAASELVPRGPLPDSRRQFAPRVFTIVGLDCRG
jgi:hypothetical protein